MKKTFTFLLLLLASFSHAQTLAVGPFTISPANPTVNDNVLVITQVISPNWGNKLSQSQNTIGNFTHKLRGCYWPGMLTAIRIYTDTFNLGQLPVGVHSVTFTANTSSSPTTCVVSDSTMAGVSFTVAGGVSTSIEKEETSLLKFWPNPVKDRVHLSSIEGFETLTVTDVTGRVVKEEQLPVNATSVDVGDLPAGCYIIRFYGKRDPAQLRMVKVGEGN